MSLEILNSTADDMMLKLKLGPLGYSEILKSLTCMKKNYLEKTQIDTKRYNDLQLTVKPWINTSKNLYTSIIRL